MIKAHRVKKIFANFSARVLPGSGWLAVSTALVILAGCGGAKDDPELAFQRASNAIEEGRWDWARVYLAEDLAHHPERIESLRNLGIAWVAGHGGGLSRGVEHLQAYLRLRPDDQIARQRLLSTLARLRQYGRASEWTQHLADDPNSFYLRALVSEDESPKQVLSYLDQALEKDPQHAHSHAMRAAILEREGDLDAALSGARQAVAIDPFDSRSRARLIRLVQASDQPQGIEQNLEALEIVGRINQSVDAAVLAPAEELRLLRRLQQLESCGGFAFERRLAEVLLKAGRSAEGLEVLGRIEPDRRFSTVDRLIFAKLLVGCGEPGSAQVMYGSILAAEPGNITATASLALLEARLGQTAAARQRLTEALGQAPHVAVFHAALGDIQVRQGASEGAIASFREALRLAPWQNRWRGALADVLRASGQPAAAAEVRAAMVDDAMALPYHGGMAPEGLEVSEYQAPGPRSESAADWFVEVSHELGVDQVQQDGRSGERFYVETTGSGCGFLDHDGDGDLDLYLLNGAATPGSPPAAMAGNALFDNRGGRFVDVTDQAGVGDPGFSMGMCIGDYDSDGRIDFLVANYGPDRLYHNLGSGVFEEVAAAAGVDDSRWGSNCAFGDLDGDGDLDLYVSHYLDFTFANNPFCGDRARNISAYCRPSAFEGVTDSLFINQGNGTFSEEGGLRGITQGVLEKGFGVIFSDIDGDGDLDIFVANDSTPNRLYVNDGTGIFTEDALTGGLAFNFDGMATSGMGADIGDVDGDGALDVVLTNFAMESNGLYRNLGDLIFADISQSAGLGGVSTPQVGWGTRLFDFDNDGDLDQAVANGHVVDNIKIFEPGSSYPQVNRLMENNGSGVFTDVTRDAGSGWAIERVSRALAVADFNSDGRLDLLIANCNDRFDLLENRLINTNHWLGLELLGPAANRFAFGARVVLVAGDLTQVREVRSGGSFQSQSDLRLHFGLGEHPGPVRAEIRWPDGHLQDETIATVDRYLTVSYR